MTRRRARLGWLGALVWAATAAVPCPARAPADASPPGAYAPGSPGDAVAAAPSIDLDELPAEVRDKVRSVVEQPTATGRGPVEAFACRPDAYRWLMDHPDQTVRLWRRLGAKVADVQDLGGGRFGWSDGQGSEVHWDCVLDAPRRRVWLAEGKVKPALLMPAVPVRAVVVMDYVEGHDSKGRPAVRHQASLLLHADGKAVALGARLMGSSATHAAEQFLGQLEMFYAAMAWYLDQHPDEAEKLFADLKKPDIPSDRPDGR